jgi:hypothetical protein
VITHDDVKAYREALLLDKKNRQDMLIPWQADAVVFDAQKRFLADEALTKLARCGNRAAKTFTTMRDLSWKVMRRHPYIKKWQRWDEKSYFKDGGKTWWVVAPTFEFLRETIWKMYLERFFPKWYYTDDDFVSGLSWKKDKGEEYLESITFRNGDVVEFKTYSQNLLSKMGRAVSGGVYIDEMPPSLLVLSELVTRCLDHGADFILGFTPVVKVPDIREYVDKHTQMSVHQWALNENPVYRDNPEKLARAIAEWAGLPEPLRRARMTGEWYEEIPEGQRIFENVTPICVDDFEIPLDWRQVRFADPASHRTGVVIFAEDPNDGQWYATIAREIEWTGKLAKADDIEGVIDSLAPYEDFRYYMSVYDNAEAWFGAHSTGKLGKWRPCVHKKNKEILINNARDQVVAGRVKFFKVGAAALVRQIYQYRRKPDGAVYKKKDHLVDPLQYFCREMPPFIPGQQSVPCDLPEEIKKAHFRKLAKKWAQKGNRVFGGGTVTRMQQRRQQVNTLRQRGVR